MQIPGKVSIQGQPARERILLTAYRLFYGNGIRATGVDRVIAESGVAKVTFYRHFPSKNDLVRAFLNYRHERWMNWFVGGLERHGGNLDGLVPTLAEWFGSDDFRGCAFINSVGELGNDILEINEIARSHKQEMIDAIEKLLPKANHGEKLATAIAMAVDGAIVRAQYEAAPQAALEPLTLILASIQAANGNLAQAKRCPW